MEGLERADGTLPHLFAPFSLRGVTAANRIVVSPMCQYASEDGAPSDWHLVHMGRLALSGAGIVFVEETAVEERGRKTHHCAGIWRDEQIAAHRRISDFIRARGGVPAIQLGHAGRRAACHGALRDWAPLTADDAAQGLAPWPALAPSPIAAGPGWAVPREMTEADIQEVVAAWAAAAVRADKAGFDILEIHGAHGYLIHQFLSPLTNARGDGYGGARAKRMRFALELSEAVRAAWPAEKPLFFRVSAVDGQGGAWRLEDSVALARALGDLGVDLIDCSSGGITGASDLPLVPRLPGYQVPFAETIRRETGIMTLAVGLLDDPGIAEAVLAEGKADLVALARVFLEQADWPLAAARALGCVDPYALLPEGYAQRLRRRDAVAALPINRGAAADEAQIKLLEGT